MKKILLIAVLGLMTTMSFGQSNFKLSNGEGYLKSTFTHPATDTITNSTTKNLYVQVDGFQDAITIQPTFVKISGTAAATAKLQGSVDNVAYTDVAGASSYTVTDVATQTTAWVVTNSPYRFYRVNIVPTGTQSVKVTAPVIVRKR